MAQESWKLFNPLVCLTKLWNKKNADEDCGFIFTFSEWCLCSIALSWSLWSWTNLEQNLSATCIYLFCFFCSVFNIHYYISSWKGYTIPNGLLQDVVQNKPYPCFVDYGSNQGEHTLKHCKLRKLRWTHGRLGYSKSMLEEIFLIGIGGLTFEEFCPLVVDLNLQLDCLWLETGPALHCRTNTENTWVW